MTESAHGQRRYAVRFEWGPTGAAAVATGVDIAVVVDVLSFSTTVSVAADRGVTVWPFRWHDERAERYAAERGAVLAVGRREAADRADRVSLSPVSVRSAVGVERLVLPSPNGSTICAALADASVDVVAGCLRNRSTVADWLAVRLGEGARVAVVAAGERWPDGSLRPAVEDLWGAGAVVSALVGVGDVRLSPEAQMAVAAYDAVAGRLAAALRTCASGRELVEAGFPEDAEIAAELDDSTVVPLLRGGSFGPGYSLAP